MRRRRRKTKGRKLFTRRRVAWLGGLLLAAGLGYLAFEAHVIRGFERIDATLPTRIIARPLVLRPGDPVQRQRVANYLSRVGYESVSRRVPETGQFSLRGRELRIGRRPLRVGDYFDAGGQARVRFGGYGGQSRVQWIRDAEGEELPTLVLDPEPVGARLGPRGRDRVAVRLDHVPAHLIDAVLTVEDRRFYEHGALDPRRIAGAAISNLRQRRVAEGGSTLTQQLARTLFLSTDRTLFRKMREAAIAVALEHRLSKPRLLEAYINHVYLGQDGGAAIHGFGRAAQFYFGRDISVLTPGQSAMLVGIVRGPSLYSPRRHPQRARARRDLVLRQMHALGHLDDAELAAELEADLELHAPAARQVDARWYLDFLDRELSSAEASLELDGEGLTVVSSLEPAVQRAAERAVSEGIGRLERYYPRLKERAQPLQAALVALDPHTGDILAMVGGRSYGSSQFNRATDARRQPGSAFKPIVALAALNPRLDAPFTLASVLQDEPLRLETPAGVWTPSNSDRSFVGPVRLREALEGSRNVPFARLGMAVGADRIVDTARRLGIESYLAPWPSLALGASEVTLLELTAAYGVLAARGRRTPAGVVQTVLNRRGEAIYRSGRSSEPAISAGEAYLVTSALEGVVERGTGSGVVAAGYRGPVAAKSGTTNGSRDAWFVGYTPELAVGVWVGFDDGTPVGLSGSRASLPIFADFLLEVLGPRGGGDFQVPSGVEWVNVDPETGRRAGWGCRGERELFLVGTAPESVSCGYLPRRWRGRSFSSGARR